MGRPFSHERLSTMSERPDAGVMWTEAGPRSAHYDDIYYAADGLAEARSVFLDGCGLPGAWAGRRGFTVAELGFGTGLNILALLQLWRDTRPLNGRLHLFSVETHPLTAVEAGRALAAFPEVADLAARLLPAWPGRARGFERIELPELGAVLDVATAEAGEALEVPTPRGLISTEAMIAIRNIEVIVSHRERRWRFVNAAMSRDVLSPDGRQATARTFGGQPATGSDGSRPRHHST